jgi:hypothetical protein
MVASIPGISFALNFFVSLITFVVVLQIFEQRKNLERLSLGYDFVLNSVYETWA